MAFLTKCLVSLCVSFMMSIPTTAQSYNNISLGSSLIATQDNSTNWLSPNKDFAFGFQQVQNDGFLLAIWFNKVPDKAIVWSANRNVLVGSGSTAQVTESGQLVLNDQLGNQIWNASVGTGVSYAAMLDTGNFVLASKDGVNLWQSFDHPTDTILPTQTLGMNGTLIARYTETNYSHGRFKFIMQADGNLVMYTTNTNRVAYWATNTVGSGYQVIFNQSGSIFLVSKNGGILENVTSKPASTDSVYQRAIFEYDGVFRQYVYTKVGSISANWTTLSFQPPNFCKNFMEKVGTGACGDNGYCSFHDSKPSCLCPPSYDFVDPMDESQGCKPNFISQTCGNTTQDKKDLFEVIELPNTKWTDTDIGMSSSRTEDWCKQTCLDDCNCSVAMFTTGTCWIKKIPLSDGLNDPSVGGKSFIKVMKNNSLPGSPLGSPPGSPPGTPKRKNHLTLVLILSIILGGSTLLNVLFLIATQCIGKRRVNVEINQALPASGLRFFTYKELEAATEGFKEEVGSGGFGIVYKGLLPNEDTIVAVKKLDRMERENEDEFKNEVKIIGGTNHRNLVQLKGYCYEKQQRLLVYEYMSNGSLASYLFSDFRPRWLCRIQIACGIARGLVYLHEECSTQIIHCDIKPQNILLDGFVTAKISDFGLSKFLKKDQSRTVTRIRGTKGYVAPEWFKSSPITVKVDVYSFGIVLLELITCRKSVELEMQSEDQEILSDWACDCYRQGMLHLLVEGDEEATDDIKRVEKFVMIAIWCIQEDPSLRPSMKKVTQMLEGAVQVPAPPDPNSFMSSTI